MNTPMSSVDVYVTLEFTPNPNTLKYSVNRTLIEKGAVNLTSAAEAERLSPIGAKLFRIPGIVAVMIGKDFVTITKNDDGDWDLVHAECSKQIESHLKDALPVLNEVEMRTGHSEKSGADGIIEAKIKEILDREIRPAVATDGGDITFEKFEGGTVFVHLQGACSGCPSSTATLKHGIEKRLKQAIPEVNEVVAI